MRDMLLTRKNDSWVIVHALQSSMCQTERNHYFAFANKSPSSISYSFHIDSSPLAFGTMNQYILCTSGSDTRFWVADTAFHCLRILSIPTGTATALNWNHNSGIG